MISTCNKRLGSKNKKRKKNVYAFLCNLMCILSIRLSEIKSTPKNFFLFNLLFINILFSLQKLRQSFYVRQNEKAKELVLDLKFSLVVSWDKGLLCQCVKSWWWLRGGEEEKRINRFERVKCRSRRCGKTVGGKGRRQRTRLYIL